MALKEDFTKQLESQLAVWQGQIKDYQDRLAQAGTEAHVHYEKAIGSLRENADQASKLLAQARGSSEAAWKDMQAASGKALAQLQQGWADALKRFQ
jgi:cell envelope opacity-associated protein A